MTFHEMGDVVSRVKYKNWRVDVYKRHSYDKDYPADTFLQVRFWAGAE